MTEFLQNNWLWIVVVLFLGLQIVGGYPKAAIYGLF